MISRPILIVDGLNLFIRHFQANPSMAKNGEPAGGIVGFLKNIQFLADKTFPKQIIVIWEGGGSLRKRQIFKEYKNNRKPIKLNRYYDDDIPDSLLNRNWQIAMIIKILRFLPICQVYVENVEADDVIGYITRYTKREHDIVIASSDKDFYQLLDRPGVKIYSPTSKRFIEAQDVIDKFGIAPRNFCLAKALNGDPSDNIPGLAAVGFTGISKRFPAFSSTKDDVTITQVLESSQKELQIRKTKFHQNIIDGTDIINRNWKLMYLDTANLSALHIRQIESTINNFKPTWNKMELYRTLAKEGLNHAFDSDRMFFTLKMIPEEK